MNDTIRQFGLLITMVIIRILTMLVAFKYLSVQFGPNGFGKLSQVTAIAALFSTFAGGGLSNGLVREVAASKDASTRTEWLKAALVISFASILALGILAMILYQFGAQIFLADTTLAWIFVLIGIAQIGTAIGNTALAYLSGLNEVFFYSLAGILGNIFSVAFVILASYLYGFSGAVAGSAIFALAPSIFAVGFLLVKKPQEVARLNTVSIRCCKIKILSSYTLAMIVAASAVPLILVYMRSRLGQSVGWHVVGEWQSVARIGDAYIQVFGVLFANFLLPRLSGAPETAQSRVMQKFVLAVLSIFFFGAVIFYVFAPFVLAAVYSDEFSKATPYVMPQLLADLLKIIASFFMYRFISSGKPSIQAIGEVMQAAVMLAVFQLFLERWQGLAAVWAYVAGAASVVTCVALLTVCNRKTGKYF
jgi:O-antigen/teichoic acid export membrane protein